MDVVSSPELATLLVAILSSAHKLDFPSSRFAEITHSNAQPKELRTGLVLAELLASGIVKAERFPNCISALLLHLISSPNLNFQNTLVHAIYLNIEHLFSSQLDAKRIPSLIRTLLDFETHLPIFSGQFLADVAIQVELSRYRVFNIILVLLNFREEETTQTKNKTRKSSFFDQNSETDDPLGYYERSRFVDLDSSQYRLHFETNGTVSAMEGSPSHKPISLLDLYGRRSHFRSPSSISIQQKSLLLEISQSLLSRISERLPHFMDRTWWEGLKQPSDPLSRSYSSLDRPFHTLEFLDEHVCPTVMNIVTSLSVLAPELPISWLTHVISPLLWSESESVFWKVRKAFISLSKLSNQSEFLLRLSVHPSHEHVPLPPSPPGQQGVHNHPPPPPPPLTSQPAHQPIAEKVSSPSPALLCRDVSSLQDGKTIPLLKVFVQRGLHFETVSRWTTNEILNGVDHESRMAMLTYLVEELVDRRTKTLFGIPQVIVGLKFFAPQLSDLILPFSRLIRFSIHAESSFNDTHRRAVLLNELTEMVVWMLSTPIEREADMKTFRQMASLLSSALISSLVSLPTLRSKNTSVALPLPISNNQVGSRRVAADRASVWKTSLLEEGLFDFLSFFFNEGIAHCVSFFGFNCTFPISPAIPLDPKPPLIYFRTGYRHGRRRRF
ncbi:hypothetical protein BLNAU_11253 [Blattamonas nauphoetae]|uniref:Uncharacterized protein n=1 Tax=Blattamonas nauphoetae TaxID=2049346 RepID=A0ABQ9XRC2_9EUKA|nr:hypothetical protein BLNAU_11253 [Blattamonas nauphoetae]